MFTSLLAATALAATPNLTIRRDCDAAGGLPSAKAPLTVAYASANGKVAGTATLGTLVETTAKTKFDVEYDVDVSGTVRSFALTAHAASGDIVAKAVVDVDMGTGEVLDAAGDGFTTGQIRRNKDGTYTIPVVLSDDAASATVVIGITDVTADGANLFGDPVEQGAALLALGGPGRQDGHTNVLDDYRVVNSLRQTWSGEVAVDTAYADTKLELRASADQCLPEGVEAPADGTLGWTETLVLQGSARKPKWKSVSLGLREAATETWVWPFVARVEDASPEGVYVTLSVSEGALAPRATGVWVTVPARERLSGATSLARQKDLDQTEKLTVNLHRVGFLDKPAALFTVTRAGGVVTCGGGVPADCEDIPFDSNGDGVVDSYAALTGPGDDAWDGTLSVSTRGPAVWADLDVAVLVTEGASNFAVSKITFPLATTVSIFEGEFVFDADASGGVYGWECDGCGDGFEPFFLTANLGTGTRTSSTQAGTKTELL